ncbi:MAG: hypothetical protein VB050_16725 [Geobacteraceae bacterium]|nr:hypothetical protein [Geobacteraceae bacterium]
MEKMMIISDISGCKEERHYVVVLNDDEETQPELHMDGIVVKGNLRVIEDTYRKAKKYIKSAQYQLNRKKRG